MDLKNFYSLVKNTAVVLSSAFLFSSCGEDPAPPLNVDVSTADVTNIGISSATTGGFLIVTGSGTITAKGVCWSTSPGPTISAQTTNEGGGTSSFVSYITGLTGGTTYYVRAYATGNGTTFYGDQITFTTISPKGGILGKVTDMFDYKLKSVSVKLLQNGTLVSQTTSDTNGDFRFEQVTYGSYTIELSLNGFVKKTESIVLNSNLLTTQGLKMEPESLPSAALAAVRTISNTATSAVFELDILVVDATGAVVQGLAANNFSINGFSSFTFNVSTSTLNAGTSSSPYSASMLLDQSGSITGTDPNDSRIQAAKIFMSALGTGDNVHLSAFAGSGRVIPYEITEYGNGFTSSGASYFPTLDMLAGQEGGGTPLYKATNAMINYVSSNAPNANKALLVFTDGQDTDGGFTIQQITTNAKSKNVRLFTIGLSASVDTKVLAEMAYRGNGAFIWASDARQLVSAYKSLGALLRGTSSIYRTRWTVNSTSNAFPGWVTTSVKVAVGSTVISVPFYLSVPN